MLQATFFKLNTTRRAKSFSSWVGSGLLRSNWNKFIAAIYSRTYNFFLVLFSRATFLNRYKHYWQRFLFFYNFSLIPCPTAVPASLGGWKQFSLKHVLLTRILGLFGMCKGHLSENNDFFLTENCYLVASNVYHSLPCFLLSPWNV